MFWKVFTDQNERSATEAQDQIGHILEHLNF